MKSARAGHDRVARQGDADLLEEIDRTVARRARLKSPLDGQTPERAYLNPASPIVLAASSGGTSTCDAPRYWSNEPIHISSTELC